jgi:hypothetical protein
MLFIIIIGLIIVALMVYTSTRIKRTAAAAFEPETIETDEFIIQKPEGFLHNLNARPGNIFEAYSKEFSTEHPERRIGTASIQRSEGRSIDNVASDEISSGTKIVEDFTERLAERAYRVIVIQRVEDGVDTNTSFKLAQAGDNVYKLEVNALTANSSEQWVETFIDSFRVK